MSKCNTCEESSEYKCFGCDMRYCESCGYKCMWCNDFECNNCIEKDEYDEPIRWSSGLGKSGSICSSNCGVNCYYSYTKLKEENKKLKKKSRKKKRKRSWEEELKGFSDKELWSKFEDICRETKRRKKNQ